MHDHFAALQIRRAAWLEPEEVKERFFRLSAVQHPDAGGSAAAFTDLNAAWQVLRDPAARLRHFLELEHPEALAIAARTPAELGDLFMGIAAARQTTQQLAARLSSASSPLSRSLLESERRSWLAKLETLHREVAHRLDLAQSALRSGRPGPAELATLLAHLVFLGKWDAQLQESLLGLN
jgi:curved DNA-binding protein CbpA